MSNMEVSFHLFGYKGNIKDHQVVGHFGNLCDHVTIGKQKGKSGNLHRKVIFLMLAWYKGISFYSPLSRAFMWLYIFRGIAF